MTINMTKKKFFAIAAISMAFIVAFVLFNGKNSGAVWTDAKTSGDIAVSAGTLGVTYAVYDEGNNVVEPATVFANTKFYPGKSLTLRYEIEATADTDLGSDKIEWNALYSGVTNPSLFNDAFEVKVTPTGTTATTTVGTAQLLKDFVTSSPVNYKLTSAGDTKIGYSLATGKLDGVASENKSEFTLTVTMKDNGVPSDGGTTVYGGNDTGDNRFKNITGSFGIDIVAIQVPAE
ncbi:hypothetical protein D3C76_1042080 [compost metagenome]